MTALVRACGLVVQRAGRVLLDGVDVELHAGEVLAVTGPSGSGKTTLLGVLAGLEPPDAGTVTLDGEPLGTGDDAGVRRGVALVAQGHALVSLLTAAENVEIALQASGADPDAVRDRAARALSDVGLRGREDHLVEELSGGQRQRVALARALAADPRVLVADEPTAELDAATRDAVLLLLIGVARRGGTVVLATHDPAVAVEADRRLRVAGGRLEPAP